MTPTQLPLPDRLRTLASGIGVSRSEVVALVVLAVGALLLLGLVAWGQRGPLAAGDAPPVADGAGITVSPMGGEELVVHVTGLVAAPGLHRLPPGARVADALDAAGGPLPDAWLDALNLARPLNDGEQLLVVGRQDAGGPGDLPSPGVAGAGAAAGATGIRPDGTVDLNRATAAELETLPGVGPVMAQRLIDHREQQGPFTAVGQLRDVRGIGEKTFQSLVDLVSV